MIAPNAAILLVEDDRVDVMTVQRALKKIGFANPVFVARNGIDALGMLRGQGFEKIVPPPALILLDLNLPKMSGVEFLEQLRADPELSAMRVIVLTSSNEPKDREAAFRYDVEDYIVKPHSFDEFARAMDVILSYWDPDGS